MIAYGIAVADGEAYRRYAQPGLQRAGEPDSAVLAFAPVDSIARSCNLLLDAAERLEDLEALVLVHPHTEIADPGFAAAVRRALADPVVGVAGAAGGHGPGLAWWTAGASAAPGVHRYHEHGGGELPAYAWAHPGAALGDVDAVDGALMVLSRWAVRAVRFDERLRLGHGYDVDYCRQVRAAGRRVITADLRVRLHGSLELVEDLELWTEAHLQLSRKWDTEPRDAPAWKVRARQAEAEREAARALAHGERLAADARVAAAERALAAATGSPGWRLTAPLRRANAVRRRLAGGG